MRIDDILVRVAKITTYAGGKLLTNATGFFYMREKYLFLVTNRHVVLSEAGNHRPDWINASVHYDPGDLTRHGTISVPLYDKAFWPQWKEHPRLGRAVDVVAVPINDSIVLSSFYVTAFGPEHLIDRTRTRPLSLDVSVVGFPLGFHDTTHALPLIRSATIASAFGIPFKGEPYFLTDGGMHRGGSGSPVVARASQFSPDVLADHTRGLHPDDAQRARSPWVLLGVHRVSLDVSDRDPIQDQPLDLNTVWYGKLVDEIVRAAIPSAGAATA